jgi:HPr kinase/phosphorylase
MDRQDHSDQTRITLHASAVCVAGRGLLIRGASGAGKSSLALAMLALGADLVADDRVVVSQMPDQLRLSAPPTILGMIEARGVGILSATTVADCPLAAIVDLDVVETERLPPMREDRLLGRKIPLLHNFASPHFPAALMQYLKGGRKA